MFSIRKNNEIVLTKGDDSGFFSVEINKGTDLDPIPYKFYQAFGIYYKPENSIVTLDKSKFKEKASAENLYVFAYSYSVEGQLQWHLEQTPVNLLDYGITFEGIATLGDQIIITYFTKHLDEVYFSIFNIHSNRENYRVQKIFRNDGKVITNYEMGQGYSRVVQKDDLISNDNIFLFLDAVDVSNLDSGEYKYQVHIKFYDFNTKKYIFNTITNVAPFYLVD